jgi:hypothetical protein
MSGIGRNVQVLLDVVLSSGEITAGIKVKGTNWGDYFIHDSTISTWKVFSDKIIIGDHTGNDGLTAFGIGRYTGEVNQSATAVAIGNYAGNASQGDGSVALGRFAGGTAQLGVAIGLFAGYEYQQIGAVSLGTNAGYSHQQSGAVAVGYDTGSFNQQVGAVAIGTNAGQTGQQVGAVAIGTNAGQTGQHTNSIVIGQNTGANYQNIVIDASPTIPLIPLKAGVFIRPVRGPMAGNNLMSYNTATKEVFYNGSSERYKYDIQDAPSVSIQNLQPREFKYKLDGAQDIGLIAEETYECDKAFAYLDKDQLPEGIQWNVITTALLMELKQIKQRIEILKLRNTI